MTLLRTVLLTSMGALALAACGESKTDPAKEQEVVAKVAPPAGKSWSEVVRVDGAGMVMGNPEAPLKLEEFSSEARREGTECVSTCRAQGWRCHTKKKKT